MPFNHDYLWSYGPNRCYIIAGVGAQIWYGCEFASTDTYCRTTSERLEHYSLRPCMPQAYLLSVISCSLLSYSISICVRNEAIITERLILIAESSRRLVQLSFCCDRKVPSTGSGRSFRPLIPSESYKCKFLPSKFVTSYIWDTQKVYGICSHKNGSFFKLILEVFFSIRFPPSTVNRFVGDVVTDSRITVFTKIWCSSLIDFP